MASIIPVPTLSTKGYVKDPVAKIDFLLSHFFLADYNQSYLYTSNVISLPEIMQKNGGSVDATIPDMERKLRTYLTPYYANLDISVTNLSDPDLGGKAELLIKLVVDDTGTQSSFERGINFKDSIFQKIVTINNG
jgi:hypothetical protein